MIKVSVALLEHQDVHLNGEEPPSFLEVPDSDMIRFPGNVAYDLHVSKVGNGVLVKGSIGIGYDGKCGRCLEHFSGKAEVKDLCLFIEEPSEQELDLSEDLRSELVMRLPYNCICQENCRGLCKQCGVDLNKTSCNCHDSDAEENPWGALDQLNLDK